MADVVASSFGTQTTGHGGFNAGNDVLELTCRFRCIDSFRFVQAMNTTLYTLKAEWLKPTNQRCWLACKPEIESVLLRLSSYISSRWYFHRNRGVGSPFILASRYSNKKPLCSIQYSMCEIHLIDFWEFTKFPKRSLEVHHFHHTTFLCLWHVKQT